MRLVFLLIFFSSIIKAQSDSAMTVPMVGIGFGYQLPSGDMINRFGGNFRVGLSFLIKTKKKWIIGCEGTYIFRDQAPKEDVLVQIRNSDGFVVDNSGQPASLKLSENGLIFQAVFGRLFKFLSPNQNSGLMVNIGLGYMEHKIRIYDNDQKTKAVNNDLSPGYDRLTNGFCISEFIGYLYMSDNTIQNFYFGFDSYQAWTSSVRKFNYDTGLPDTKKRMDILSGFRVGWILPLYKKQPLDVYYY